MSGVRIKCEPHQVDQARTQYRDSHPDWVIDDEGWFKHRATGEPVYVDWSGLTRDTPSPDAA